MQAPPLHPLEPLSIAEQLLGVEILRENNKIWNTSRIVSITLKEPLKEIIYSWTPENPFSLNRSACCVYFDNVKNLLYEATVDLGNRRLTDWKEIHGKQGPFVYDEMDEALTAVRKDPWVKSVLEKEFGITNIETLTSDMWIVGYYGPYAHEAKRLAKLLLFLPDSETGNPYAKPIEGIRPILDLNAMKVIDIENHGHWHLAPDHKCPYKAKHMAGKFRSSVKPLEIYQPLGPSFKAHGNYVEWEKWQFVVGFNAREGLVLHDIRLDKRPVIYRASVAEMMVPYGDPQPQQATKNAFDEGELGLGICANSLELGRRVMRICKESDWNSVEGQCVG